VLELDISDSSFTVFNLFLLDSFFGDGSCENLLLSIPLGETGFDNKLLLLFFKLVVKGEFMLFSSSRFKGELFNSI